jgi:hypothetical protein
VEGFIKRMGLRKNPSLGFACKKHPSLRGMKLQRSK